MLRKLLFSLFIIITLGLSVFSIWISYQDKDLYNVKLDPSQLSKFPIDTSDTLEVTKETVLKKLHFSGEIACGDKSPVLNISFPADANLFVSLGDIVELGDVIYESNGTEYVAEAKLKCMGIDSESRNIAFFDCSKLYIETKIPVEYLNFDIYDTVIHISCENKKFNGKFSYIDCINNNGYASAKIEYDANDYFLYPGTSISAEIIVETKEDVVAVPLLFIIDTGLNSYKVMVLEENEVVYKTVKLGLIGTPYAEIISGVNEHDIIVCPEEEYSLQQKLNGVG